MAEEGGDGARKVLTSGALDHVKAIFGFHVAPAKVPVGIAASKDGPFIATSGLSEAEITGERGHAALPRLSKDPVVVAAPNVIISLQHLISREADPIDSQKYYKTVKISYKNIRKSCKNIGFVTLSNLREYSKYIPIFLYSN